MQTQVILAQRERPCTDAGDDALFIVVKAAVAGILLRNGVAESTGPDYLIHSGLQCGLHVVACRVSFDAWLRFRSCRTKFLGQESVLSLHRYSFSAFGLGAGA